MKETKLTEAEIAILSDAIERLAKEANCSISDAVDKVYLKIIDMIIQQKRLNK